MEFVHGSFVYIMAEVITSLLLFAGGFFIGKIREKRRLGIGKNLEEYDFYPFQSNKEGFAEFDLQRFRLGMHYFLKKDDYTAARQLLFLGEQHRVREQLDGVEVRVYEALFKKYNGKTIAEDNSEFLENYKRIVRLMGSTFKSLGIEILLHDLLNPSRSIVAIEEGGVTGRSLGNGTTNLVIDLKKRKDLNEDKLNYELNIGSRRFKCTTIPIYRKEFDLVGAICINIDVNYINEYVLQKKEAIEEFFEAYCQADFKLDENILSREEFEKARHGKKHWRDMSYALLHQ